MAEFEAELVLSAFDKFNEASAHMEAAYHRLAEKVRTLSDELEETNRRLRRTVREKERIGAHLRAVLESLSCGVLVSDGEGRVTHVNRAASCLLFDADEAIGRNDTLGALTDSRPELAPPFDADGPSRFEATLPGAGDDEGRCLQVERRALLGDEIGEDGAVFVIRDLTELRALERQAQAMERLAAMGEMALELAHEVRNPLGRIRLHASLLAEHESLTELGRSSLEQLQVGIRSLDNVACNMMSFGRPQAPHRVTTQPGRLVEELDRFLEPLTRERHVHVDINVSTDASVALDRDQFRQALLNLWLNALNAMPRGGRLTIDVSRDGDVLTIALRDSGPGMSPELVEHVFDPFFTTDRRGTGLGLAVASAIVRNHGGDIVAESEPGEGATFKITIPLMEETCAVMS